MSVNSMSQNIWTLDETPSSRCCRQIPKVLYNMDTSDATPVSMHEAVQP